MLSFANLLEFGNKYRMYILISFVLLIIIILLLWNKINYGSWIQPKKDPDSAARTVDLDVAEKEEKKKKKKKKPKLPVSVQEEKKSPVVMVPDEVRSMGDGVTPIENLYDSTIDADPVRENPADLPQIHAVPTGEGSAVTMRRRP